MRLVFLPLIAIIILSILAFYIGRLRIANLCKKDGQRSRTLIHFYGFALGLWTFASGMLAWLVAYKLKLFPLILPVGVAFLIIGGGAILLSLRFHARLHLEKIAVRLLMVAAAIAVIVTTTILFTLLIESLHFFSMVPVSEFLLGTRWNPSTSLGHLPEPIIGHYGVVPLLCGTLLITVIAMIIAVPLGLLIAIYTAEYANPTRRKLIKPLIEMLAGVPTIIYGFFALIAVAPLLHRVGEIVGWPIAAESALGAGLVMGLMIIPFVSSLSDDALNSIPKTLRENSWALGATSAETILKVVVPAALPGIASAVLLAFSRAIGETMLVVMAAGLTAHLTLNPLHSVTTITVQIVALLTGDQEFNSPKTLSAFALGLLLFLCTLVLNIIALRIMRWHREKYAL
jgi:phosphate transport system permease protein